MNFIRSSDAYIILPRLTVFSVTEFNPSFDVGEGFGVGELELGEGGGGGGSEPEVG